MTETVYLPPTRSRGEVYHTSRDCSRLHCDAADCVARQREPLDEYGYRVCSICASGRGYQGGRDEDSQTPLRYHVDDITTEVPTDD